ncbi:hypothetical protein BST81_25225 [Leptolyngbya sp. 'hensonii']|uniref:DUF6737 family protein n=1 Tax=Leptolyngbya sp. 'hensonii' TaxID=1922337 RepID=UPI00094F78A6|nr:DUF6737 family protein [Leptolyngbya sp. 'hensonii']OLP15657.1 hypothetical protein BST81_25225 [Leptolyngbya sp. 'hensonii']
MSEPEPLPQPIVNPWTLKPWWCQPWSILLTGIGLIVGSWFLLKILWVTILVAIPLLAWMGFFLLLWPNLVMQSLIDQEFEAPKQ